MASLSIRAPRAARHHHRVEVRALALVAGLVAALAASASADPVNVAVRGKARQSSTVPAGEAWRAIDGSVNGNYQRGSVTHTVQGTTEVWFELDLLRPVAVDEVRLHNRTDCCHERLTGVRIELSAVRCDASPRVVIASAPAVTGKPAVHVAPFVGSPTARYVCLRQAAGGWISLAEVEVMSSAAAGPGVLTGPNIGLGEEPVDLADTAFARQSSTYGTAAASRAIDGNTNGTFTANSVTHTLAAPAPWLEIGLGLEAPIDAVLIYNRTDCCGDRLAGAKVELSLARCDDPERTIVATSAPLGSGTFQRVEFADQRARYVCIRQSREVALSIAEVKVMATPPAHVARNLARGRIATMSTVYGGSPLLMVDGNTDGNIDHGTLALTNNTTGQWMQVDLMASAAIGSVVIHNRIHYGADRLDGTRLQVSDTPCSASASVGTQLPVAVVDSSPTVTIELPAGTSGRYVCLRNTRAEYLTVAEIQVFPPLGPDVGYPATSRQSTTAVGRPSRLAIDGNPLGVWTGGSVTETAVDTVGEANDTGPWLEIDLLAARRIGTVVIRNRTDDWTTRLARARVELSLDRCDVATRRIVRDERLPIDNLQFTTGISPKFKSGDVAARVQLDFVEAPAARFVCIRHDQRAILSVAEVEVYAGAPAENLARRGVTRQSTTIYGGDGPRATDGWIDGVYGFGSVTRTDDRDPSPWLEVDLRSAQPIRELAIWNRTDKVPERLIGAMVELADGPCDRSDRRVTWSATLPNAPFLWRPARRTAFVFTSPRTAQYVCVRHASGKVLSVAEVQVFGLGDDEDPAPEPPPVAAMAAVTSAAQLGEVAVTAPQTTFTATGDTISVSIRIAGGVAIPCQLEATGPSAYTMTCGDGAAIAMAGTLASATSYDLTSTGDFGFADLAGRGLFPAQLAAGLDAMASVIGVGRVKLGLDNRRGFFIRGTLAFADLPSGDPVSKALRATAGVLGTYAPGFDSTPAFQLVPSLTGATAKLLLRLEVINTCAGDRDISAIGAGFKFNKGALELALSVTGPEVEVSAGFAADALIRPTRHDPWLRFSPGIELGASTTGSSVTLKGQLSGACPASCAADCSCEPSDCGAPWHPIGNPLFSLTNGYLELGVSTVVEAVPLPVVNVAFDDASFGPAGHPLHGSFAMGFDYRAQQFGFQFAADRMPLLGALGVLIPTAGLALPSWLEVKNPRISFATRGFRIFNADIPAGFRVAGGLDLAPIGLRGSINAVVPPSAMDLSSLAAGSLTVGAPYGTFALSIDTSELLRKVLSMGPFSAIIRPIVERTLWLKGFDVKLAIGGTSVAASANVRVQMFGTSFDVGIDVAVAFDPKAVARQVGAEVKALIDDPAQAIKGAFDEAKAAAEVAAQEIATALATGATIVINGVSTATSKVIAASGTVAAFFEDAGDVIVEYGNPTNW